MDPKLLTENRWQLYIDDWSAFSPYASQPSEWSIWANSGKLATPLRSPDLSDIPPMLRRRLSPLGKTALWAANTLLNTQPAPAPIATLFCSRHGELDKIVTILKELAAQEALSPTIFSLSVHNASAGIYSMAKQINHNITAMSAGADGICATLLEAYGLLANAGKNASVLCVIYDESIPDILVENQTPPPTPQAIALLVSNGSKTSSTPLTFTLQANTQPSSTENASDLFLQFLLRPDITELTIANDQRLWRWFK